MVQLETGPRGGVSYERGGRKVYVKRPGEEDYEKRRSYQPTTRWHEDMPKKGRERAYLYEKCGDKCFLEPNPEHPGESGFPICPACRDPSGECACEPTCAGITAAKARGYEWEDLHPGTGEEADSMQETYCKKQKGGAKFLTGAYYDPTGRFSQSYCPTEPPCGANKVKYQMRKQPGKYCCRNKPVKHMGPRQPNSYIEFLKAHKGQGHSIEELREMYHASK